MSDDLSTDAQAMLLLTAPLILGRGEAPPELLSPAEYNALARRLWAEKRRPAELIGPDGAALRAACWDEPERLERLLARGFLLSQTAERWRARALWAVSRADPAYPRRVKAGLRDQAPPILYGCGAAALLNADDAAVVGVRGVVATLRAEATPVIGVLAGELAVASLDHAFRAALLDQRLALVAPQDPLLGGAGPVDALIAAWRGEPPV